MAENSQEPPIVVCDAGPIIHLDELGCAELLIDFPSVLIPKIVWEEVISHRPTALRHLTNAIQVTAPEKCSAELEALGRVLTLHYGELEALRVAQAHPGCLLLTDDTAARLAGRNLGLLVRGTLGILVRAIRREQRTKEEVLEILHTIRERSTLHVRESLLQEIIHQVGASNAGEKL